jgi:hypothetical protein
MDSLENGEGSKFVLVVVLPYLVLVKIWDVVIEFSHLVFDGIQIEEAFFVFALCDSSFNQFVN